VCWYSCSKKSFNFGRFVFSCDKLNDFSIKDSYIKTLDDITAHKKACFFPISCFLFGLFKKNCVFHFQKFYKHVCWYSCSKKSFNFGRFVFSCDKLNDFSIKDSYIKTLDDITAHKKACFFPISCFLFGLFKKNCVFHFQKFYKHVCWYSFIKNILKKTQR
jgi:hypothetical protein